MGLNTAVTQFTASKLGDLSKNDIDRMFGAMSTVIICGALIIGLLGVVLGPVVVRVLDIGEGMQTAIAVLCLAVAIQARLGISERDRLWLPEDRSCQPCPDHPAMRLSW